MDKHELESPQTAKQRIKRKIHDLLREIEHASADMEALRALWGQPSRHLQQPEQNKDSEVKEPAAEDRAVA